MKPVNSVAAIALLLSLIHLLPDLMVAQKKEQQAPIRVFVFAGNNSKGFTDPGQKDRNDSAEDLKKELRKKLVVTDNRDNAEVIVEVVARGYELPQTVTKTAKVFGDPTGKTRVPTVSVTLTVGDYSATLVGQKEQNWRSAADDAAKKIEAWVQDNYDKLLARRAK